MLVQHIASRGMSEYPRTLPEFETPFATEEACREYLFRLRDEFAFRFNRRTSRHRGMLFYRLVQQAAAVEAVPYKDMVAHCRGPKPQKHKM